MGVLADIGATWRNPAAAMRHRQAVGMGEGQALGLLFGACIIIFLSMWLPMRKVAEIDPSVPLEARLGAALYATLFVLPLIAYALAALSRVSAAAFGGRGSYRAARIALFAALLAIAPVQVAHSVVLGLFGPLPWAQALGLPVFVAFMVLWLGGLRAAEFGGQERAT